MENEILFEKNGFWVSNEGTNTKPNYHVWKPNLTHSVIDSAYNDLSLAIVSCKYLANR